MSVRDLGIVILGCIYLILLKGCVVSGTVEDLDLEDLVELELGDLVRIAVSKNELEAMQEGHGDYNEDMAQDLGVIGEVTKVRRDGDVAIKFQGTAKSWIMNPKVLSKKGILQGVGDKSLLQRDSTEKSDQFSTNNVRHPEPRSLAMYSLGDDELNNGAHKSSGALMDSDEVDGEYDNQDLYETEDDETDDDETENKKDDEGKDDKIDNKEKENNKDNDDDEDNADDDDNDDREDKGDDAEDKDDETEYNNDYKDDKEDKGIDGEDKDDKQNEEKNNNDEYNDYGSYGSDESPIRQSNEKEVKDGKVKKNNVKVKVNEENIDHIKIDIYEPEEDKIKDDKMKKNHKKEKETGDENTTNELKTDSKEKGTKEEKNTGKNSNENDEDKTEKKENGNENQNAEDTDGTDEEENTDNKEEDIEDIADHITDEKGTVLAQIEKDHEKEKETEKTDMHGHGDKDVTNELKIDSKEKGTQEEQNDTGKNSYEENEDKTKNKENGNEIKKTEDTNGTEEEENTDNKEEDITDLIDQVDEKECPSNEFQCSNGDCIPANLRCNGKKDCPKDIADEENCTQCQDSAFSCGDGNCIPTTWVCDGAEDCKNGRDEDCSDQTQSTVTDSKCGSTGWQCILSDQCISSAKRCDGDMDCDDGSDEVDCTVCRGESFNCDNGECVPYSWRCDGEKDCANGHDEKKCSKSKPGVCLQPGSSCANNGTCRKKCKIGECDNGICPGSDCKCCLRTSSTKYEDISTGPKFPNDLRMPQFPKKDTDIPSSDMPSIDTGLVYYSDSMNKELFSCGLTQAEASGPSAYITLVRKGTCNLKCIKRLKDRGFDINANVKGKTALWYAINQCANCKKDGCAQLLVKHGADIEDAFHGPERTETKICNKCFKLFKKKKNEKSLKYSNKTKRTGCKVDGKIHKNGMTWEKNCCLYTCKNGRLEMTNSPGNILCRKPEKRCACCQTQ